ncbi:MAG: hypothetical protein KY476_09210, partial [Planctomycetes bacterium]|nr:hypothetical protein [Planctomycetota bacterium]
MPAHIDRRRLPGFLSATILVTLLLAPPAVAAELRAGAAKADITPRKWPMPMVGTFNERLAEKAWDPLYARAL